MDEAVKDRFINGEAVFLDEAVKDRFINNKIIASLTTKNYCFVEQAVSDRRFRVT